MPGIEPDAIRYETGTPRNSLPMRELPMDSLPRERLLKIGAHSLADHELLALIWRTGTSTENVLDLARRAITEFKGLTELHLAPIEEITRLHGIGPAKAVELKAALELGQRVMRAPLEQRKVVRSPADIAELMMLKLAHLEQEYLYVVLLNTKNHVIDDVEVYRGSVNQSQVRISEIFREPIRRNAVNIVLVHNHPSGDPTPSPDDVRLTEQLVQAGKLLDITVLDHVVIGSGRYVSLKERGLGFRS